MGEVVPIKKQEEKPEKEPKAELPFRDNPIACETLAVNIGQAVFRMIGKSLSTTPLNKAMKEYLEEHTEINPVSGRYRFYTREHQKTIFDGVCAMNREGKVFKRENLIKRLDSYCRMCGS